MAATTSGWQYAVPNDTLVAWPAVSQAVADKLETNIANYKTGLVHLGTFSATSSSLTVDNVFNANYDNYKIVVNGVASAITTGYLRLRTAGGSPANVATAYDFGNLRVNCGSGALSAANSSGNTQMQFTDLYTNTAFTTTLEFQNPFLSVFTFINGFANYQANGDFYVPNGVQKGNTSCGGFTFYQNSGNFTSITARVYGYRNA